MAAAIAFGSQGSAASASSIATIAGLTFNAAAGDRIIAACLASENAATINGVTIGGVTATMRVADATGVSPNRRAEIWTAAVPTGTTGDVVVTLSADTTVSAATYSITGADATPTDTDKLNGGGADISLTALTIPSDGVGVATWCNSTAGTACTWTGASEDHDTNVATPGFRHSSARVTTIGTNTITADGATIAQSIVGVAWGPAAGGAATSAPIFSRATRFIRRRAA